MAVVWLNVLAFVGLIALGVPVLIHLLTHQRRRHVPFPTVRFLRQTRLAAMRRRAVRDWWLLAIRLLILATAVAALAAPLFLSEGRRAVWRERVARAIVIAPGPGPSGLDPIVESERAAIFASAVFTPADRLADGLRDAMLWLQRQPPSAREIVVVGDLRVGSLRQGDIDLVSAQAGLRFLPLPTDVSETKADMRFRQGDAAWRADVTLRAAGTRVAYAHETLGVAPLTVRATRGEEAAAADALAALQEWGYDVAGSPRQVVVAFKGADLDDLRLTTPPTEPWMRQTLSRLADMTGGASHSTLVVQTNMRASDRGAAQALERIAAAAFAEDRSALEPARISAQRLAEWSKPPAIVDSENLQDEGDRRWLWGAVLGLMVIETLIRKTRPAADRLEQPKEARVA